MKLVGDRFFQQVEQSLAPCYLLASDEVLFVEEAADAVVAKAKAAGITEHTRYTADARFDWHELKNQSANLSLFGDRKLIDVSLPSGKPGKQGGQILKELISQSAADCLLIRSGKLERSALKTAWVKSFEQQGVLAEFWPLAPNAWPNWIRSRLAQQSMQADDDAIALLVDRVEGNLLAARQEIQKLHLLFGEGQLSIQHIQQSVADHARFDVFGLVDVVLQGKSKRALRMLKRVEEEGVEPTIVLWALLRDWRVLCQLQWQASRGGGARQAMGRLRVWPKRQPLFEHAMRQVPLPAMHHALAYAKEVDRIIKGQQSGRTWDALAQLVISMTGQNNPVLNGFSELTAA